MNQQYDVIVIGTGEKTKSTVKALSEQGQQVMYIELLPEMLATMVCHHPKKNTPSSQTFQTDKEQNQMKTKIHLQKQTVQTSVGETITYTFHVEESVEITEVERVEVEDLQEDLSTDHSYLYQPSNNHQQKIEPFELELVDDFMNPTSQTTRTVINDETITFYEEESDSTIKEADQIFYEIDDQPIEEEHDVIDLTEDVTPTLEDKSEKEERQEENTIHQLSQSLKPSTLSQQKEREHELREKLIRRKGKTEPFNLLMEEYQGKGSFEEQQESIQPIYDNQKEDMDRSAFLNSVLNKPSYSPRESRLRKRLSFKSKPHQSSASENTITEHSFDPNLQSQESPTHQDKKENEEKQKVYSFEPFSSRRRARAQKKSRMLTAVERFKANPNPRNQTEEQHHASPQEEFDNQDFSFQQPVVEESSSNQQSMNPTQFPLHSIETTQTDLSIQSDTSTDTLKKDAIEFEEPYGGYHSLDDFLPPYSQNGRKRQEIDEIEKRKIALRGLHNLINNLG